MRPTLQLYSLDILLNKAINLQRLDIQDRRLRHLHIALTRNQAVPIGRVPIRSHQRLTDSLLGLKLNPLTPASNHPTDRVLLVDTAMFVVLDFLVASYLEKE